VIRWLYSSLIFSLVLNALAACSEQLTVEQQVIVTIREMEEKVEAGERRPFMDYLAGEFTAQGGSMNREQVRALFVYQLNRHKRLSAQLFPISVTETGEKEAAATFRALVTGGPGWFPESGQVFDFETTWKLEEGEWLLTSADWDPVPLEEAL
jgi:hypothetical protein